MLVLLLALAGVLIMIPSALSEDTAPLIDLNFEEIAEGAKVAGLTVQGVEFSEEETPAGTRKCAIFDGIEDYLELAEVPHFEAGDFTLAGWFFIPDKPTDLYGDLVSRFHDESRLGFSWTLQHFPGVTTSQSNTRNLAFGLNDGKDGQWVDRGRPGNAVLIYALTVFDGNLYAGTYEPGEGEAGTVYRYNDDGTWTSCGSPDVCNSVTSLCVFEGRLYAGASRYQGSGSRLEISENQAPGGKVFRYEGGTDWTDCGRLGDAEYIFGMAEFDGHLHATLIHSPNPSGDLSELGLYRYEGGQNWKYLGHPGGRPVCIAPYNGALYATGYDGGEVGGLHRYNPDGTWTNLGVPGTTTQTYSMAFLRGGMYVGTWPEGKVYRLGREGEWVDCGQLGEEQEVMGMAVYNGALYAGTLPTAEVYRYDGGIEWTNTGRLDHTPGDMYRRAWTMAVYKGELFCGVLPSGHVHSLRVGQVVTHDRDLGTGWKHLAAVREGTRFRLYVDGVAVASGSFEGTEPIRNRLDLPLQIGFGPHEYFRGKMAEVEVYGEALEDARIEALAKRTSPPSERSGK